MKRRQLARDLREDVREQIRKLEVEVAELRGELRAMRAASRTTCSTATAELVSCSSMCGSHVRYSSETLSPAKCGAFFAPSLGGHPCRAAQSAALYH
jgi:hypothetical protein